MFISTPEISSWAERARLILRQIVLHWVTCGPITSVAVSRCGGVGQWLMEKVCLPGSGESWLTSGGERAGCGLFYKTSYGLRPETLFQLPSDLRTTKAIILPSSSALGPRSFRGKSHLWPETSGPSPYYLWLSLHLHLEFVSSVESWHIEWR